MYKIESLFKHNIFFTPSDERTDDYSSNDKFSISITYISKIKDLRYLKLNIEGYQGVENLFDQIDPFLYYLLSKYQKYKGTNTYKAHCQVDFCFGNYCYPGVKFFYTRECFDENILFLKKDSRNIRTFFESHSIFDEPFQIRIFLHANYKKKAPKISKPFKTDQCVVCLSKKPEVLFIKCVHLCVCLECEEAHTFRKCPYCRTQIETKVMIKNL